MYNLQMKCQQPLQQALDSNLLTILNDRIVFFDGDTVITSDKIYDFVGKGLDVPRVGELCVTESSSEIDQYNTLVDPAQQIRVKETFKGLDLDWNIPEEYLNLHVEQYLLDIIDKEIDKFNDEDGLKRALRFEEELEVYRKLNLIPILRVIIFVINTLRSYNIVWGIGRGSCVASYVLYLIGVHDVDSVEYELDYTDFLRAPD